MNRYLTNKLLESEKTPGILIILSLGVSLSAILLITLYPFRWLEHPFVWMRPGEIGNYVHMFQGLQFGGYSRCCKYLAVLEPTANVLLFVPFSFFLTAMLERWLKWPLNKFYVFLAIVFLSALQSSTVEFLQVFLPDRSPTVTDLVMNTLGGIIGFIIFRIWGAPILRLVELILKWPQKRVFRS